MVRLDHRERVAEEVTWWTRVRDSEVTDLDTKSSRELNKYLNVHHILQCVR